MKQMKLAKIWAFMLIILVEIYFNWKVLCKFMPLVNYSISISISLFSNKLIYIFSALYSEHIGRCKDWISYISHVSNIFWYTWNLNFRNDSREFPMVSNFPVVCTLLWETKILYFRRRNYFPNIFLSCLHLKNCFLAYLYIWFVHPLLSAALYPSFYHMLAFPQ